MTPRALALLLALLLALVACTKDKAAAPDPEPAPAVAPPVVAPAPISFLDALVDTPVENAASIDATKMGSSVAVYLIERSSDAALEGAEYYDLQLVVASASGRHIVDVDSYLSERYRTPPLGSIEPVAPLPSPRPYDAKLDGFDGVPSPTTAPLLFVQRLGDMAGEPHGYLVAHEGDTLVIWSARSLDDKPTWTKQTTVQLAKCTTLATPAIPDTSRDYDARSRVAMRERIVRTVGDDRLVSFDIVIGNVRAHVGTCLVGPASETAFAGERAWSKFHLPDRPAEVHKILATRMCISSTGAKQLFLLERDNLDLNLWTHTHTEWRQTTIDTLWDPED